MTMNTPEPEIIEEPPARTAWTPVGAMPVTPAPHLPPTSPLTPTGPLGIEEMPEEESQEGDDDGAIKPDNWHQG